MSKKTHSSSRIILIAGPVRSAGRAGHHDYAGGCALIAEMLQRLPGVEPVLLENGWPDDETVFDNAAALVFYDNGGGKQGFLANAARRATLERLVGYQCGVVVLHQAAGFPAAHAEFGRRLLGGVYVAGESRRGHWKSRHSKFPAHPITRNVAGWSIRDGWLNDIRFQEDIDCITPLVWSDKRHGGGLHGPADAVVSWVYEPPTGHRAFVYTGLDNHRAWRHDGLRHLIGNGILWSARFPLPADPAWTVLSGSRITTFRSPRESPVPHALGSLLRRTRRTLSGRRKW